MVIANGKFLAEIQGVVEPARLFRYRVYDRALHKLLYDGYTAQMEEAVQTARAHLNWLLEHEPLPNPHN